MPGPLEGASVIELAGLGPAPFGAMMLADMGADVVSVDRTDRVFGMPIESASGWRRSVTTTSASLPCFDIPTQLAIPISRPEQHM